MNLFEKGSIVLVAVMLWLVGSFLIFQFGPSAKLMSWPDGIFFDMRPEFSDQEAILAIDDFGRSGRELYQKHFWLDLLFITLQTTGIVALMWYATSKFAFSGRWFCWLLVAPVFLMGLVDIAENLAIRSAITSYPETTPQQLTWIRRLVGIKLASLPVIPVTVLLSLVMLTFAFFRRKNSSSASE